MPLWVSVDPSEWYYFTCIFKACLNHVLTRFGKFKFSCALLKIKTSRKQQISQSSDDFNILYVMM